MNRKILILGSDKMLGRSLVSQLRGDPSHDLVCINQDALDWYRPEEVKGMIHQHSPEILVCLLGKSGGIPLNQKVPADLMSDNLLIALNVMQSCLQSSVEKAIFLGSSCMYPRDSMQPMCERFLFSGYLEPTSQSYAVAKLASFQLCEAFNRQYGTNFICVIPNNSYGPHDDFNPQSAHAVGALISRFHQAKLQKYEEITLLGSGLVSREFIYVDDVAQAILRCLAHDVTSDMNPINIGCGTDVLIRTLADKIAAVVGFKGRILWDQEFSDGAPRKFLDNSKLMILGWSATTNLEQGLALTYEWYVSANAKREVDDKIPM